MKLLYRGFQVLCLLCFISIKLNAQCTCTLNMSFEHAAGTCDGEKTNPKGLCQPDGWVSCSSQGGATTDIGPGQYGFNQAPVNGPNYLTFWTNEFVSLPLCPNTALTSGKQYCFSIRWYRQNSGFNASTLVDIFGGTTSCSQTQKLWTSPPTSIGTTGQWNTWNFCFTPTGNWTFLTFRLMDDPADGGFGGYVALDDWKSTDGLFPPQPTANCSPTVSVNGSTICSGSCATLTANGIGGTPPYKYFWSGGQTTQTISVCPTSTQIYTVTLTDAGGFTSSDTALVIVNPTPTITVNSATICPGASATLVAAGATTYTWNTGANTNPITVTPTTTTSYSVTGTTSSCTSTAVSTVVVSSVLAATINSPTICAGGTATLTIVGGTSFLWSNNSTTNPLVVSPTVTTAYTATVSNVSGCTGTVIGTVVVDPIPFLVISNPAAVCVPGTVDITAAAITAGSTGGGVLTYWIDAAATQTLNTPNVVSIAGTYYIKTTTAGGCTDIKPVVVTFNASPVITINSATICPNTSAVLTATGATTYSWNTGSTTNSISVAPTITTIYTVTGTDLGCSSTAVATVVVSSVMAATINSPTICAGVTTTLTIVSGATSYSWNTGAITNPLIVTPQITTPYSCTVTNASGCIGTITTTVVVEANPILTITNPIAVCSPGIINITGVNITVGSTGGGILSYWTNAAATTTLISPMSISTAGTYYIKAVTAVGCSDIKPVVVTFNTPPISNAGANLILCSGTTGTIGSTAINGYTYAWSLTNGLSNSTQSNPIVNLTNTGSTPLITIYTVTTTEKSTGCKSTDTVMVTVSSIATANAGSSQNGCTGASFGLMGSVGGSATNGIWSGGAGLFSPSNSDLNATYFPTQTEYGVGSVSLTLTSNDPVGPCTFASSNVVLNFHKSPIVDFTVDDPDGCPTHCVSFKDLSTIASPDVIQSLTWNFGDGITNTTNTLTPNHCYPNTGSYAVSVKAVSNHGCSTTKTKPAYITVFPVPAFDPTPKTATILDPFVTLNNQSSTDVTIWHYWFGDGDSISFTPPNNSNPCPLHSYANNEEKTYTATLIVQNTYGCVDTVKHNIIIGPMFTFYIPNTFTPNGDGYNDVFFGTGVGIIKYDLFIFNRWGEQIFEGNSLDHAWDGKVKGSQELAQQDSYVWKVNLTDVFGKNHDYVGHVILLK